MLVDGSETDDSNGAEVGGIGEICRNAHMLHICGHKTQCNVFLSTCSILGIHRTQVGDLQPVCPRAGCHSLLLVRADKVWGCSGEVCHTRA